MATDSGYSNQKKKGLAQFETVHNLGSSTYGKVITPKSVYEITPSAAIVSVTDIKGSNGLVEYWNIELTAHGASIGNIFRIDAGALINTEYEIIQVVDANNFYILPITDIKPAIADTGIIMGWVTQKLASDGSVNVTISSAPTSYNLDGVPQTVEQDTSILANNKALPNLNFIYKDGVQVPITKDTGNPSNTVGIPVELVAASGTPINITAGDINVQLTDQGLNFDSLRLGDGSGNYARIDSNNNLIVTPDIDQGPGTADTTTTRVVIATDQTEIPVADADALAELQAISASVGGVVATEATIESNSFSPGDIRRPYFNPEGMLVVRDIWTQQEVNTSNSWLFSINGKLPGSLGRKDEALSLAVVLSAQDGNKLSNMLGLLTAINTQIPATLGTKAAADSLAVTLSTEDNAAIDQISTDIQSLITSQTLTPSYSEALTIDDTAAVNITAPIGAKWAKVQADDTNNANVRIKIGGTATSTSGIQMQAGRSEDFSAVADITARAEVGGSDCKIYVQWGY